MARWIEGPDPDGSGIQAHSVYQGGEHPCCGCQACTMHFAFIMDEESLNNALRMIAEDRMMMARCEPTEGLTL